MRFKKSDEKFTIYAISGNHTVSFAIEMERENCDGLLGFAVERKDVTENTAGDTFLPMYRTLSDRPSS